MSRDLGKGLCVGAPQFLRKFAGDVLRQVVYATYLVSFVFEVAGHVGTHAADTDQSDSFVFGAHS